MIRRIFLLLPIALVLAGCAKKPAKLYDMQGEIKALDPATKTATIQAGKIGDWMEAMTMDYRVKPDSEFQKLHVGDHIQANVVVADPDYYVTSVQVVR